MARGTRLRRGSIVQALTDELEPLTYVHAFWEAGAAFDRVDEWSDIDLYIVVDDAAVADAFRVVEKTLESVSPIELKHEVSWPLASGIFQKFYRLEDTSEYLLIDLAVMTQSAPDKFLTREIHATPFSFSTKADPSKSPPSTRRRSRGRSSNVANASASASVSSVPSSGKRSCEAMGSKHPSSIEPS